MALSLSEAYKVLYDEIDVSNREMTIEEMNKVLLAESDSQVLNEVYFGKSKNLLEIERLVGELKAKYDNQFTLISPFTINSDPKMIQINRLFEKEFGFSAFQLQVDSSNIINAYTMPISINFDVWNTRKNLVSTSSGFKYNPKANYSCMVVVYCGLFFNPNYTAEEIVAVILHEVGHNFFAAINGRLMLYSTAYHILAVAALILANVYYPSTKNITRALNNTNLIRNFIIKFDRLIRENQTFIAHIFDIFTAIMKFSDEILSFKFKVFDFFTLGFFRLKNLPYKIAKELNPLSLAILPMKLQDEKTADNFATMYGYGAASASVERKFVESGNEKSIVINNMKNIPIISHLYNMNTYAMRIILSPFDEHPGELARIHDQSELLKNELTKNGLDPKMRKIIMENLKAIEIEEKKLIDTSKGIKDRDFLAHAYNKILSKYFNNKDLKEFLIGGNSKNRFNDYDKAFDYAKIE